MDHRWRCIKQSQQRNKTAVKGYYSNGSEKGLNSYLLLNPNGFLK